MTKGHHGTQVRVVGDGTDYETIQAAHDDLPHGDPHGGQGSGCIVVDGSYDSHLEEFPIRLTKYVDVRGSSRTRSVVACPDPETDVFRLERREGDGGRLAPNARTVLSNLTIRGGRDAVVADGVTRFSGNFLTIDAPSRDGFSVVRQESQGSLSGGYLERVDVHDAGRHGFSLPSLTNPHGYVLLRCSANHCAGIGARLGGFTINVLGGAYQYCGVAGVEIDAHEFGAGAVGLHNTYLEYNGRTVEHPREVILGDNVRGAKLDNCYLTGHNADRYEVEPATHAAIESRDNAGCEIDHCTFRGYHWADDAGLFDVATDTDAIDLHLGSHHRFHGAEQIDTFLRRPPDVFYSDGVRHGRDPTATPGRYDGEFAYADGAVSVWHADASEWRTIGGAT